MYPHPSYSVPPTYSMPYEYYTSSTTPPPPGYGYYSPRYATVPQRTSSTKQHSRRATQDYTYSSPRVTSYYVYPDNYYTSSSYAKRPDHVSSSERQRKGRATAHGSGRRASTTARTYYVYGDSYYPYDSEEDLPAYSRDPRKHTPPPPYSWDHDADHHAYYQQYQTPRQESYRPRPRTASYSTPPPKPKPRQQAPPPKRATATDRDARDAGIPAGYSYKNWDPNEEPILLLGSVFDANSLGKWIYDWTVAFHGAGTPICEVSGDLWLLLIQLAGKIKRAEECQPRIRHRDDLELIEDFLDSGERLWQRFNKLLKVCESYMLKSAKRERGSDKLHMGNNSAREFVDSIFGRDRELESTEKIMTGIRLWSMRFDANCEEVLRASVRR